MAKEKPVSFESMMVELESILAKISDEGTSLEESIELYAQAADLIAKAQRTLEGASVRIEEIRESLPVAEEEEP